VILASWLAAAALLTAPVAQRRQPDPPLTILVSFDGWRWDYDTKAPAPRAARADGARRARPRRSSRRFPSKTIPNHYSMATGLYPGHHGMIANVIRDPATGACSGAPTGEVTNPMWWAASRSGTRRSGRG
jgi:alkaline phosphatase D